MTQVPVTFTRQAAPSFKAWKLADPTFKGFGRDSRGRGGVPTARVVVAYAEDGSAWVHRHIFRTGEHEKARKVQEGVEARGFIDATHWRRAERGEG